MFLGVILATDVAATIIEGPSPALAVSVALVIAFLLGVLRLRRSRHA